MNHRAPSSPFQALIKSIERETLDFEQHADVAGQPFLPEEQIGWVHFKQHCKDLDVSLAELAPLDTQVLKHWCMMGFPEGERWSYQLYELHHAARPRYEKSSRDDRTELEDNILRNALSILTDRHTIFSSFERRVSTPREVPRVERTFFVLTVYVVFGTGAPKRILRLDDELPVNGNDTNRIVQPGIVCDAIVVPAPLVSPAEHEAVIAKVEKLEGLPGTFQSYHVVRGFGKLSAAAAIDMSNIVEVARLLTMQYQREWGGRDRRAKEIEEHSNALAMTLHGAANSLRAIDVENLCTLISSEFPPRQASIEIYCNGQREELVERELVAAAQRVYVGQKSAFGLMALGESAANEGVIPPKYQNLLTVTWIMEM